MPSPLTPNTMRELARLDMRHEGKYAPTNQPICNNTTCGFAGQPPTQENTPLVDKDKSTVSVQLNIGGRKFRAQHAKKISKNHLSNLIKIVADPNNIGSAGYSLVFIVPFEQWSQIAKKKWGKLIRFLTEEENNVEIPSHSSTKICMCSDIAKCTIKNTVSGNDSGCTHNVLGICVPATNQINKTPLTLEVVGYLTGVSKQRVNQIYAAAIEKMVSLVKSDPTLVEYCESLGLKTLNKNKD